MGSDFYNIALEQHGPEDSLRLNNIRERTLTARLKLHSRFCEKSIL